MGMLLALPLCLTSCARVVVLHPIEKSDIFRVTKGTQIGMIQAEKDGYFLSDMYIEKVAKAQMK